MIPILTLIISITVSILIIVGEKEKAKKKKRDEERKRIQEQERREQARKDELKREFHQILNRLGTDWSSRMDPDKIEKTSSATVVYTFENGDTIVYNAMKHNELVYVKDELKTTYSLGLMYSSQFIKILSTILDSAKRIQNNGHSTKNGSSNGTAKSKKYVTIMSTIRLRKEQLDKMKKNDPERIPLENELKAAEGLAASIK